MADYDEYADDGFMDDGYAGDTYGGSYSDSSYGSSYADSRLSRQAAKPRKPKYKATDYGTKSTARPSMGLNDLNADEKLLFDDLRQLRLTIARQEHMPPYIIFSDKTLVDMCVKKPDDKKSMLDCNGVGENKYERYGEKFLEVISRHFY